MEELSIIQQNEIELNDYQDCKGKIGTGLIRVTQGFVEIGYGLKQIRDKGLYKLGGYGSITEFAKVEYKLEQWDVSRFIAIAEKFTDGSSPKLLPEYEGYKYDILKEMLNMSENELQYVTVSTTRAEIRDIKQAKRESDEEGHAPAHVSESLEMTQLKGQLEQEKKYLIPGSEKVMIDMFRDKKNRQDLKELAAVLSAGPWTKETELKAAEIINPSGHRMGRKGTIIMVFEEKTIKYDDFKGGKAEYTYTDFMFDLCLTFDMTQTDPWVAFYGEPEPEKPPEPEKKPEPPAKQEKKDQKPATGSAKKEEKPIKTQSEPKKQESKPEEALPGQYEVKDYPDLMPENSEEGQEEDIQRCRVCGCTDDHGCPGECYWVEDDLCSACAEKMQEDKAETVEAEIVQRAESTADIHNYSEDQFLYSNDLIDISLNQETGDLQIIIKNNQNRIIKRVKTVDSCTGCIVGEVEIE